MFDQKDYGFRIPKHLFCPLYHACNILFPLLLPKNEKVSKKKDYLQKIHPANKHVDVITKNKEKIFWKVGGLPGRSVGENRRTTCDKK